MPTNSTKRIRKRQAKVKALKHPTDMLNKTKINRQEKQKSIAPPADEKSATENTTNILMLNDDCLLQICKYFTNNELITFSRVCQRFSDTAFACSKIRFHIFDLAVLKYESSSGIEQILKIAGVHIKVLVGKIPWRRNQTTKLRTNLLLISKYCPNVQTIKIYKNISTKSIEHLLWQMRNVTEVHLFDCNVKNSGLRALRVLPKLKKLLINVNYCNVTGRYLPSFTDLTELSLYACQVVKPLHFVKICKSLKNLQKLNIQFCMAFAYRVESINQMSKHCLKLEELSMSHLTGSYESIAQLPCLKRLEIYARKDLIPVEVLSALADFKKDQLEYFNLSEQNNFNLQHATFIAKLSKLKTLICPRTAQLTDECLSKFGQLKELQELDIAGCPAITNAGLLELVVQCPKLHCIDVQSCSQITDAFVFQAIKDLVDRRKDVSVIVTKTSISESILNNAKYLAAESYLKILFDTSSKKVKNSLFTTYEFFTSRDILFSDHMNDESDNDDSFDDSFDDSYDDDD